MSTQLLSDEVKIVQLITITAGAAAATPVNGTVVDMAGYDGCLFVVQVGTIAGTAVTSIKVQQDTVVGMGTAADLLGSNQTIVDTADDTVFCVDIKRPSKQFLRLVVSRGTANATVSAMAFLYRGRNRPAVNGAGVNIEKFVSPAEGTA